MNAPSIDAGSPRERFSELLPFYVNGTLDGADRAWVEVYLHSHPAAAGELQWCRSLQQRLHEDVPAVSSEVGLERSLQRIRSEGPKPLQARRAAQRSLFDRAGDWFAALLPRPLLRPAFAGALAVVAVQALVIGGLVGERNDEATELRALRGSVVEKGPYLKVNFKADAREAEIRLLLIEVQGTLAGGPGQLGDWYLRVPEPQLAAITSTLESSRIVESVAVVDALPPRQ